MECTIRNITKDDSGWIREFLRPGGADFIVSRGRKIYPAEIGGFCAEDSSGKKVGFITFEIKERECEIVTIDAFEKFQGIGTALINRLLETVRTRGISRIWLITTNDNLEAVRFYQRRGFHFHAIHKDALQYSRKLKPTIPEIGYFGIPIRDEIEFEMLL